MKTIIYNRAKLFKLRLGCPRNKEKKKFQTETRSVSVCFVKPKTKKFGLFRFVSVFQTFQIYIETIETSRTFSKQTETTLNFHKKHQNMLSIKLFRLVFCMFQFTQNIKTLCFGIEAKQPEQTILKQTKPNRKNLKNPKFPGKNTKICSILNCFGWSSVCFGVGLLFVSVQSYYTRKKRCQYLRYLPTPKKRVATFPSAAGMSLTKLSLGGNNLTINVPVL